MSIPSHCTTLDGKDDLAINPFAEKFRTYGYKTGTIDAFKALESADIGVIEECKSKSGVVSVLYVRASTCVLVHSNSPKIMFL